MNDNRQLPDLGPLNPLLDDPEIAEIMVNSYDQVFIEKHGRVEEVPGVFSSDGDLWRVVDRLRGIAEKLGRRLDDQSPMVDLRLSYINDQRPFARLNVVLPPIAAFGPTITILKHTQRRLSEQDLITFGAWDESMALFLRACVLAHCTLVVGGNVGSGKTTVLNLLLSMIPQDERVVTVENALELRPDEGRKHIVRLESRPADHNGQGEVTIRELVINALRMRPDRLVLGEARSIETLELIHAINTGHRGAMFSLHAASARDILTRLEVMCTMHPAGLPLLTLRQMIADAIDVITYQERLPDGKRKFLKIAEVTGMQGDMIAVADIFEFRQTGTDADGSVTGYFTPTGYIPSFARKLESTGVDLPDNLFTPR